jgi:CRISPR-associated protein Cas6/Cse3/CasE subtype I-E
MEVLFMFLNSIKPKTKEAFQIISMIDSGSAHNIVWEITHRREDDLDRDWLFRVEKDPSELNILSTVPIEPMHSNHWDVAITDYPQSIPSNGEIVNFRLSVNAQKTYTKLKRKLNLVEYYGRQGIKKSLNDMITEWMKDREQMFGFSLKSLSSLTYSRSSFYHNIHQRITAGIFHISGMLCVIDSESYIKTIRNGIGGQRSFGCGLLMEDK